MGIVAERKIDRDGLEQERLVHAIESAIEVRRQDQFHAWVCGPLHALLPHESFVCMEVSDKGEVRNVDHLEHNLTEAALMAFLCHPENGLAVRLALSFTGQTTSSCTLDAASLAAHLQPGEHERLAASHHCSNAVIHRAMLVSGDAYFFVLFNVVSNRIHRSHRVLKLLSSHLKMTFSRAIARRDRESTVPLTGRELEILHWMREGKSNREISGILGISAITLKNHIAKLYRKLDVQNRAEAVARGLPILVSSHGDRRSDQGDNGGQ